MCSSSPSTFRPPEYILERKKERKLISPIPRGGRRISSRITNPPPKLPIASFGTIFTAIWSSNGGVEAVVSK